MDELSVPDESAVEAELAEAREIELLQTVYNANRRVLEVGQVDLLAEVERGIAGDELECWVCGGTADREVYEERLSSLSDAVTTRREREYRETVEALEAERDAFGEKRMAERDLEDEIQRLSTRLDDRTADLETEADRHETLDGEVEALSAEVEVADERLTDVGSEIKYIEAELEDAREELASLERRAEGTEAIADRRDELSAEIEALRTRKKREARDAFDLVVARDGREVGPDALSEGEVELLGFVVALAGYEAFEVGERVPVILLDRLGALAGENLHRLVGYFEGRAAHLVTTAYPEQSGYEWHTISPAEWAVVSDSAPTH